MDDLIDTVYWLYRRDEEHKDAEFIDWVKKHDNNSDNLTTIKFLEMPIKKDSSDMDEILSRYKKYKDHELARVRYNVIESLLDNKKLYIVFAFPYNHNVHNCWNELTRTYFTVIVEHRDVDDKIQDVMKDCTYDIIKYVYV